MLQIKIRWGDLGSPVEPGTYRCGPHMVEVMPGDIKLAKGNPDAVFTAIHPNFYPDAAPYLLTGVDLPPTNPEVERGSGGRLPIGSLEEEQELAKKAPTKRQRSRSLSVADGLAPRNDHQWRGLLI